MKGLKTRKKGICNFVMYFLLLYYIISLLSRLEIIGPEKARI